MVASVVAIGLFVALLLGGIGSFPMCEWLGDYIGWRGGTSLGDDRLAQVPVGIYALCMIHDTRITLNKDTPCDASSSL